MDTIINTHNWIMKILRTCFTFQKPCLTCFNYILKKAYLCFLGSIKTKLLFTISKKKALSQTTQKLLLFSIYLLHQSLLGQMHIQVKDLNTKQPLDKCEIYVIESDQIFRTSNSGDLHLKSYSFPEITLKIFSAGYESQLVQISTKNNETRTVFLKQTNFKLEGITLSGGALQKQNDNPFHIELRTLQNLTRISTMNMGEIISKIPGVYQASLGNGISKPVIRGMQGMRIVTLINGLRIEGQQWGGDHGMGMSQLGIGSLEIIKGPASLLYGTDALGGVLYFKDESFAPNNTFNVQYQNAFYSNTLGIINRLLVKKSFKNTRFFIGASYVNHADYRLPNTLHALNSRFNETVVKGAIAKNTKRSSHDLRYTLNNTHSGIPGNLPSDSIYSSFEIDHQLRSHPLPSQYFWNHYVSSNHKWYLGKHVLNGLFGFTHNRLIEFDNKVESPNLSMTLKNYYHTIKWTTKLRENITLNTGIQGMLQKNTNAENTSEQLIPDSYSLDEGIFSIGRLKMKELIIQGGIRYDVRLLESSNETNSNEKIMRLFRGFNGSLGTRIKYNKFIFRSSIASGFRAPHLTEFLSNGFHMAVLRYEIGDLNLKKENAVQFDVSSEWKSKQFAMVINPFINYIREYIYLQPLDSVIEQIPVFQYKQQELVTFIGIDFGYEINPVLLNNFNIDGSITYVTLTQKQENNISIIPAPRFQNNFSYRIKFKRFLNELNFNVSHTLMAGQNLVAMNETPSKSYQLLDIALACTFHHTPKINFSVGIKNLFNTLYIDHLSRLKNVNLPAPGRNIYIRFQFDLR